jgi:hypothetical protein
MEGLLAARSFLADQELNQTISRAAPQAAAYLVAAQVDDGPYRGAFTRFARQLKPVPGAAFDARALEVRVDYTQHALSAMLECAELAGLTPRHATGTQDSRGPVAVE